MISSAPRQTFGLVYKSFRNPNPLYQPPKLNENYFGMKQKEISGDGLADLVKSGASKVGDAGRYLWDNRSKLQNIGEKASDLYASDIGKTVQNLLPSSDATARPGFAGERHAILKLANGKNGVANFMGQSWAQVQQSMVGLVV